MSEVQFVLANCIDVPKQIVDRFIYDINNKYKWYDLHEIYKTWFVKHFAKYEKF